MPTIKEKLYFNYNGRSSREFGLIHINTGSGMFEETLIPRRNIRETKIRGNDKPIYYEVEHDPIEFSMEIAFEGEFTDELIEEVIDWLFTDYYCELYFEGKENRVFICMPVDDTNLIHNGLQQGYVTLTMRCNSPYIYSPIILTPLETVTTSKTITITNNGFKDIYPEISIKKIGDGNIEIKNITDNNKTFLIQNLVNGEDIYLNCEQEIIETDAIGVYHYSDIVGDFPKLIKRTTNTIQITGDCQIQFRFREKYRF